MKASVKKALGLLLAAALLLSLAGCMAPDPQAPAPSAEPTGSHRRADAHRRSDRRAHAHAGACHPGADGKAL